MNKANTLFAYGTLMWPEVLEAVVGRNITGAPATLRGYARRRIKGAHYPGIIPSDDRSVVEGVLYRDLSDLDFAHLDRFEGEEYDRMRVCADGIDAQAYVLAVRWRHRADAQMWHPEQLRPEHLAAFRKEYKGWCGID